MTYLAIVLSTLCFVLFGAHLMFHGWGLYVSLLSLVPAACVFVRSRYCRLGCAVLLVCIGVEWAYTALDLAVTRQAHGLPWMRAALIIGACATINWLSALLLFRVMAGEKKTAQRALTKI